MDWIIGIAMGFIIVASIATLVVMYRLLKLVRRADQTLTELHKETLTLLKQAHEFTRRAYRLLDDAERICSEAAAWGDTSARVRQSARCVHEKLDHWLTDTLDSWHEAYHTSQQRIHSLISWVDTVAGVWSSVSMRRSQAAKTAKTEHTESRSDEDSSSINRRRTDDIHT